MWWQRTVVTKEECDKKRLPILLMSLIDHRRKCMRLLSHSSSQTMRTLCWMHFQCITEVIGHGVSFFCPLSSDLKLTKSYIILSRNGSYFSPCKQTCFHWKQNTAPELWFLHPTNQVLQREQYQMTGSKCHNCRNWIIVHSLWNPFTFLFSKTMSVWRSSDWLNFTHCYRS